MKTLGMLGLFLVVAGALLLPVVARPAPAQPAAAPLAAVAARPADAPTWHEVSTEKPAMYSPYYTMHDLDMLDESSGWAWTDDCILHYTGGEWTTQTCLGRGHSLTALAMVSDEEGWAVEGPRFLPDAPGPFRHYTGGNWVEVTNPVTEVVSAIGVVSSDDGWAMASYGEIMRYDGVAWQVVQSPTAERMADIEMVSADEGWAVGDNGAILHYADDAWHVETSPTTEHLTAIDALSATDVWVAGGVVLHYDGSSWQIVLPDSGSYFVSMVSADEGWFAGYDLVHYLNGQWTSMELPRPPWPASEPPVLVSIDMVSAEEGWASGTTGLLLHYTHDHIGVLDGAFTGFLPSVRSQ